jgi:hypothetical protein
MKHLLAPAALFAAGLLAVAAMVDVFNAMWIHQL